MSAIIATEETLVIETPERVPLHFALASIGNRFLAAAIDHLLQLMLILLVAWLLDELANFFVRDGIWDTAPQWLKAIFIIFFFIVGSSYFILLEWRLNGQTVGKRLLKLRVIREDGRPITFWEAAVRNLLRLFDMMPGAFYSIGLIAVFASGRDQRVGDLVAGTVVVRERETEAPSFAQVFASPVSDTALRRSFAPLAFTADLHELTAAEIEVVEAFLRRRWDLPDAARQWMAWRVATPILYKLRPTYDPQTFGYESFLEELLHRARAERRLN